MDESSLTKRDRNFKVDRFEEGCTTRDFLSLFGGNFPREGTNFLKRYSHLINLLQDIKQETSRCTRCGACQSVCPIFAYTGKESTVARGKIALAAAFSKKQVGPTALIDGIAQNCLLCLACQECCPNSLNIEDIIRKWRTVLCLTRGLRFDKSLFKDIIRNPKSIGRVLALDRIITARGWGDAIPATSGIRKRYPFSLLFEKRLIANSVPLRKKIEASISVYPSRGIALFFTGCAIQYLRPEIGLSVIKLLNKLQYSVLIPFEQECCGYVASVSGDEDTSKVMEKRARQMLLQYKYDFIVTACPTCNRQLTSILRKNNITKSVIDVSKLFLDYVSNSDFLPEHCLPCSETVTYHDSCHLARGMGITEEPRRVLKLLFGRGFVEMRDSNRCCGMGGIYGITHPEISSEILKKKMDSIKETGAKYVITGCPACVLQLETGVYDCNLQVKVRHLAQLIEFI